MAKTASVTKENKAHKTPVELKNVPVLRGDARTHAAALAAAVGKDGYSHDLGRIELRGEALETYVGHFKVGQKLGDGTIYGGKDGVHRMALAPADEEEELNYRTDGHEKSVIKRMAALNHDKFMGYDNWDVMTGRVADNILNNRNVCKKAKIDIENFYWLHTGPGKLSARNQRLRYRSSIYRDIYYSVRSCRRLDNIIFQL